MINHGRVTNGNHLSPVLFVKTNTAQVKIQNGRWCYSTTGEEKMSSSHTCLLDQEHFHRLYLFNDSVRAVNGGSDVDDETVELCRQSQHVPFDALAKVCRQVDPSLAMRILVASEKVCRDTVVVVAIGNNVGLDRRGNLFLRVHKSVRVTKPVLCTFGVQ
jgi:hypothetical protein